MTTSIKSVSRIVVLFALLLGTFNMNWIWPARPVQAAALQSAQSDLVGPTGSAAFGSSVTVLPNGNIVITDPQFNQGATLGVGAVYLYNGSTGKPISTLTGSHTGDLTGSVVQILSGGDFIVGSPHWDDGTETDAGAVTLCSATTGCSGTISSGSSLIGSSAYDRVGNWVTTLPNGAYLVQSSSWDNGAIPDAGAVTLCSASDGCKGTISASNSLVGSSANDLVGYDWIAILSTGKYIVLSPYRDRGATANAGAVTLCSATDGCKGTISASNSLVGSSANDQLGDRGIMTLPNNNYLVLTPAWDNGLIADAGAVTLCSGVTGCVGTVSAGNSLVGSSANDQVGSGFPLLLNGNYLVETPHWSNAGLAQVGAVTLCSGLTGCVGTISAGNSLVGASTYDRVGSGLTTILTNGNYIVGSIYWDNGATVDAGAVTWCSGTTGCTGVVSPSNSLVGSSTGDASGASIIVLSTGNYVVTNPYWNRGGIADAGAVTWCDGTTGCTGAISLDNSLVGSSSNDRVGTVTELANGNYVISSRDWDQEAMADAGAVTWCDGTTGCTGAISLDNSLVGSSANDRVGYPDPTVLSNGGYIVSSPFWDDGGVADTGAVTLCSATGCTGTVSAGNSLVGMGMANITVLPNGNYVVSNRDWDNGAAASAGAVTWCSGISGCTGAFSAANGLTGSDADDTVGMGITVLANGNYVVNSGWKNDGKGVLTGGAFTGAVTWCSGTTGCTGEVSAANSLVGSTPGDFVGGYYYDRLIFLGQDHEEGPYILPLDNGNYMVRSPLWNQGAGALTWCSGTSGCTGEVSAVNSLVGSAPNEEVGNSPLVLLPNSNYLEFQRSWDDETRVQLWK